MMVQGRIDYINTRDTKVGTTYGIKVNGKEYGLFKDKCPFPEGTVVKFQARENGNFTNVVKGTLEQVEAPTQEATSPSSASNSYDKRQKSIEYQSSRKLAADVLDSLIRAEAVPLPAKDKRYEAVMALLDDLTWQFFEEVDTLEERIEEREFLKAQQEGE